MKKKILAFVCAMTMVVGMSLTASAAGSSSAATVAPSAPSTTSTTGAGQTITAATVAEFAETTKVTSTDVPGATVTAVSGETASKVVAEAAKVVGDNAFVATVVDLVVPAGTGKATFTMECPNVWAGQKVTILHMKADGTFEAITPDKVENNKVTFTLSSYSPVAIVIDAAAPKTADMSMVIVLMAFVSLAAAVVCARKVKFN